MSPASLLVEDSGMNLSSDTDSSTALRMLRLSFPQKASMRGSSPLMSSPAAGLSSGELGPRLRSRGALVEMGGGEDTPEAWGRLGERFAVGGGEEKPEGGLVKLGGGEEMEGH